MERKIISELMQWKKSANRKPLLLSGARQTGKTYAVERFAAAFYENCAIINFEKDREMRALFADTLDPKTILSRLETRLGWRILPRETLIFFDEVQACPAALMSLKYFCEDANAYHIIAAGSLTGVAIRRRDEAGNRLREFSFPVGKVQEAFLYPLTFLEFLQAAGQEILADTIRTCYEAGTPMDAVLHERALSFVNTYFSIGGMPEAVSCYLDTGSYLEAVRLSERIYADYLMDTAKYCTAAEAVKIKACYESIAPQLTKENKNFKYGAVQKGKTSRYFDTAIDWLQLAGIAIRSRILETPRLPLTAHTGPFLFRLYMSDVGLLRHCLNVAVADILDPAYRDDLTGLIAENFIACELHAAGIPLYYWCGKRNAEIEFMVENGHEVVPLEVKAGKRVTSKSLNVFLRDHKVPYVYRVSRKNFGYENGIRSIPLYASFCLTDELVRSKW